MDTAARKCERIRQGFSNEGTEHSQGTGLANTPGSAQEAGTSRRCCGLAVVRLELGNIRKMTGPGPGEGQVPPRGHMSVQALTPQRGYLTDEEICNGLSTVLSSFLARRHTTAAQK